MAEVSNTVNSKWTNGEECFYTPNFFTLLENYVETLCTNQV